MCFDQDTIKLLTEKRPWSFNQNPTIALAKTLSRCFDQDTIKLLTETQPRSFNQNSTKALAKTLSRCFDQDTIMLLTETRHGALTKALPGHLPRHYRGALTKTLLSY